MKNVSLWMLALALGLPITGCAQSKPEACAPEFSNATIRVMPVAMPMQAGYVTIRNRCKTTLEISAVRSQAWKDVSLHSTQVVNGVSKMREIPVLKIAPGASLQMAPGGSHLMLMDPTRDIKAGGSVDLNFVSRDGRVFRVPFSLKAI